MRGSSRRAIWILGAVAGTAFWTVPAFCSGYDLRDAQNRPVRDAAMERELDRLETEAAFEALFRRDPPALLAARSVFQDNLDPTFLGSARRGPLARPVDGKAADPTGSRGDGEAVFRFAGVPSSRGVRLFPSPRGPLGPAFGPVVLRC